MKIILSHLGARATERFTTILEFSRKVIAAWAHMNQSSMVEHQHSVGDPYALWSMRDCEH